MSKTEKENGKNERGKGWKIYRGYEQSVYKRNVNDHIGKEKYWTSWT